MQVSKLSAGISKLQGVEKTVISANALVRNIKENTRWWVIEKSDYVPLAFSPGCSEFSNCSATVFLFFLVTVHACQILTVWALALRAYFSYW